MIATPCLMTLSRLTWAKIWGTDGRQTLLTLAELRRLRAASRNFWRFSFRNSIVPPLRSWSQSEKPPPVPRPWIAGGEREVFASGILAKLGVDPLHDRADLHLLAFALVPGSSEHEVEAA